MAVTDQKALDLFRQMAEPASITVVDRPGLTEAAAYALELCRRKDFQQLVLPAGTDGRPGLSNPGPAGQRIVAAPGWPPEVAAKIAGAAEELGLTALFEDLRKYPAGVELAFTAADLAVADTATCVLACPGEDLRLATMICDTHVLALPKSRVVREIYQAEDLLRRCLAEENMYAAFISGPSRTADIERVLTLGVHGPLEMHVVLLDDDADWPNHYGSTAPAGSGGR